MDNSAFTNNPIKPDAEPLLDPIINTSGNADQNVLTNEPSGLSQEELDFRAAQQLQSELNSQTDAVNMENSTVQVQIHISIVQAKLSRTHSFYGLSRMDPYIRLRFGHRVYQSPTAVNGDRNPRWDQLVVFPYEPGLQKFHLEIYDEKTFQSDQMIAQADIPLSEPIFTGNLFDDWYPLESSQGEPGEGLINIILSTHKTQMPYHAMYQKMPPGAVQQYQPRPVQISEEDVKSLKELLPEVDEEVIQSVLIEKGGNKESAANALLAMASTDEVS